MQHYWLLQWAGSSVWGFLIGKSTVEESGCEALAVYNALFNLGHHDIKLSEIILSIEENDALVKSGKWGANPYSLERTLNEYGVSMKEISPQDSLEQGTYIFSYVVKGKKAVHTVAAYYNKATGIIMIVFHFWELKLTIALKNWLLIIFVGSI